jgi:opacity protein-like surface antigen
MKENPMSKLIRGCFALALFLVVATSADCKELTTYISCNAGLALAEDGDISDPTIPGVQASIEFDPGYFVGLAFGNHVDKIRFEAEIGYQRNQADSFTLKRSSGTYTGEYADNVEIRLSTLLFNMYYDFKNGSRVTPYVCAGLGLGNMKIDGGSGSDAVAEYQFGAGVAFQVSEKVALDLKGRYLGTSDAEFGTTSVGFSTINAIFDVRIYF